MSEFNGATRNPRAQWRILNHMLGRDRPRSSLPVEVSSLTRVFSNIVADPSRTAPLPIPFGPRCLNSLSTFKTVSIEAVCTLLKKLNTNKAHGPDGIPGFVLQSCADDLANSLQQLYNESLTSGHFPANFKLANVVPVFKKGSPTDANNYRPISLLSITSKILEQIVHDQLQAYIRATALPILPEEQFAYRRSHSCEDALSLCINSWQQELDRNRVVAVAILDMSKAFDSVRHSELLHDLHRCHIDGVVLRWLASYLSDRNQTITSHTSMPGAPYPAERGVPQGSVLGPLLFTLYIRDLPSQTTTSRSVLFADDINLYAAGELRVSSTMIPPSSQVKYLGIVVDEFLTFAAQVDHVRKKVSQKLLMASRIRHQLTERARRTFYLSFIQSTLEYASVSYVHCLSTGLYNAIEKLSRRALRIVFGFPSQCDVSIILRKYHLLPITARFNVKLYVLVYRCLHSCASPLLCSIFTLRHTSNSRTHRVTRSQTTDSLVLPHASSRYGFYSISFLAADRWNALPPTTRTSASVSRFRAALLQYLGYPVRRHTSVGTALSK